MAIGDSIPQHVAKVENIARQLKDIGEEVSDTMIMAKLLSTLPTKYNTFASVWDSVDAVNQTLSNLRERLLREESRMTIMDSVDTALAATTIFKQQGNDHRHTGNNANSKKNLICNFCKRPGHIARFCFSKKRSKNKNKNRNNDNKTPTSQDNRANFSAFVVSENYNGSAIIDANFLESKIAEEDSWILDSGASRHISCHREWFEEFEPC